MESHRTGWAVSKRTGGTSEFILMCPIKSGRIPGERQTYEQRLRSILASIDNTLNWGGAIALSRVPTIHFARFSIITPHNYLQHSDVQPPKPTATGWDNPTKLRTWLLTVVVFDGPASLYNRDLTALIGNDLDRIFRHCKDYPGSANSDVLWAWFQSYQLPTDLFYSAYPGLSVVRIKFLETFKRRFDEFLALVRPGQTTVLPADIDAELDSLVDESNQFPDGFPSGDGSYSGAED